MNRHQRKRIEREDEIADWLAYALIGFVFFMMCVDWDALF